MAAVGVGAAEGDGGEGCREGADVGAGVERYDWRWRTDVGSGKEGWREGGHGCGECGGYIYVGGYVGWCWLRIVFADGASEVVGLCMYWGFWGGKKRQCL